MINIQTVYIISIIIVTLWTLYMFISDDQSHKLELDRISRMENRIRKRTMRLYQTLDARFY